MIIYGPTDGFLDIDLGEHGMVDVEVSNIDPKLVAILTGEPLHEVWFRQAEQLRILLQIQNDREWGTGE